MAEDSENESMAERLDDGDTKDYKAIDALDRYDCDMLDDRKKVRELSARARREAEEVMAERDQRESRGFSRCSQVPPACAPKALERLHASSAGLAEIARVGKLLKLPEPILVKAGDMLRKAFVGGRSLPPSHQLCLPTVCIEMSSRVCKRPIKRDAIFRHSKHVEKDYLRTLKAMHCLLGIRREISVAELCAEFKCNGIKATTRQTLEVYKRQFWASLPPEKREDADFSRPVFAMAALLLTAERHKNIVKTPDKNELLAAGGDVSPEEFWRVFNQMKTICTPGALSGGARAQQESKEDTTAASHAANVAAKVTGSMPPATCDGRKHLGEGENRNKISESKGAEMEADARTADNSEGEKNTLAVTSENMGSSLGAGDENKGVTEKCAEETDGCGGMRSLLSQLAAERRAREERLQMPGSDQRAEDHGRAVGQAALSAAPPEASIDASACTDGNSDAVGEKKTSPPPVTKADEGGASAPERAMDSGESRSRRSPAAAAAGSEEMQGGTNNNANVQSLVCAQRPETKAAPESTDGNEKTPCRKRSGETQDADGDGARSACKTERKPQADASCSILTPLQRRQRVKAAHSASNRLAAFATLGAVKRSRVDSFTQAVAKQQRDTGSLVQEQAACKESAAPVSEGAGCCPSVFVNDGKPALGPAKKRKAPSAEEVEAKRREYEEWKEKVRGTSAFGGFGEANDGQGDSAAEPRGTKQLSLAGFVRPTAEADSREAL